MWFLYDIYCLHTYFQRRVSVLYNQDALDELITTIVRQSIIQSRYLIKLILHKVGFAVSNAILILIGKV